VSAVHRDQQTLEKLIDRVGVAMVLEHIANICELKAEHIEATWQEPATARPWRDAANTIDGARLRPSIRAVSRTPAVRT
jgi:hypothetical protein